MVSHTCSPFSLQFIHSYPVYSRDCCRGTCAAVRGFQPESPNHSLGLQISVYLRNPGTILIIGIILQYPVIIRSDRAHPEQLSSISGQGAWAAAPLEQFASLPRDIWISACARHSLRYRKAISPTNQQLHRTPPSMKMSPLADLGFVLLGYHQKQKIPGHLWFSSWCMHVLLGAF